MTDLPIAQQFHKAGTWTGDAALCALPYEDRFFRRRKLTVEEGWSLVADFEHTVSLDDGDALETSDGRLVRIIAAPEALLAVSGSDLARLAWHIGNRHTPCQVEADRLFKDLDPQARRQKWKRQKLKEKKITMHLKIIYSKIKQH